MKTMKYMMDPEVIKASQEMAKKMGSPTSLNNLIRINGLLESGPGMIGAVFITGIYGRIARSHSHTFFLRWLILRSSTLR